MPGVYAELELSPNAFELARQQRSATGDLLDLTSSNPTEQGLLFPPELLQQATDAFWAKRHYQPDPHGHPAARAAICRYYAERTPALPLELDDILLTASTSEAYALLFALLADPGDNLLAPNVTYPLFEYLAELRNIELRPYPLNEAAGWRIDEAALLAAANHRTRGILIVSPHNPTGAVVTRPVAALQQLGLPVICDEVFAPFSYGVACVPPVAALHPTIPVLTLNGISKLFALPDMKLGWIALNQAARSLAPRLELLNDTFLSANSLSQQLLPSLFSSGMPFVHSMVERVRSNLTMALTTLQHHPHIHARPPDAGYYLFPAISGWDDEDALVHFLMEQGLLVHPGYFYGEVPGIHLLLSALTTPSRFAAGIERLSSALK